MEAKTNSDDGPRTPLGQRPTADVNQTVLRVVDRQAKALDVAAFNSFVE